MTTGISWYQRQNMEKRHAWTRSSLPSVVYLISFLHLLRTIAAFLYQLKQIFISCIVEIRKMYRGILKFGGCFNQIMVDKGQKIKDT